MKKKYFRNLKIMAALLTVGATMTACSGSDDDVLTSDSKPVYTLTVKATKGSPSTRALSDDGTKIDATWGAGEQVTVYKGTTNIGTLTPSTTGAASTTLTGQMTQALSKDDELTLKFNTAEYGYQDGTLNGIASSCDYADATITITDNKGTASNATFTNRQAIVKFTLSDGTNPVSATALKVLAGTAYINVSLATASNVIYVAIPAVSSAKVKLMALTATKSYKYTKTGVTFVNGECYNRSVTMTECTAPAAVEAVDLGLPSGKKWANMNVGATTVDGSTATCYGTYFAWGEVMGYTSSTDYDKNTFSWASYLLSVGNSLQYTKYGNSSHWGRADIAADNKTVLDPEDDAAVVNWGPNWRMPTSAELQELMNHTTPTSVTQNGVKGIKFASTNGHSIFLPSAGQWYNSQFRAGGSWTQIWTSTCNLAEYGYYYNAQSYVDVCLRCAGEPIRAIYVGP